MHYNKTNFFTKTIKKSSRKVAKVIFEGNKEKQNLNQIETADLINIIKAVAKNKLDFFFKFINLYCNNFFTGF